MTSQQNKMLFGLLKKTGLTDQRGNIVAGITNGRTESTKELSFDDARLMINYLKTQDVEGQAAQKMRKKIISLAHEMHWHLSGTQAIDMEHLNDWCIKFGYGKKKLNDYTYIELPKLVTQFTQVYKSFINKI